MGVRRGGQRIDFPYVVAIMCRIPNLCMEIENESSQKSVVHLGQRSVCPSLEEKLRID